MKVLRAIENNATADRVEELEKNGSKGTINDFLTLHLHQQYSFHLIIPPIRNCILYLGSLYQWAIMQYTTRGQELCRLPGDCVQKEASERSRMASCANTPLYQLMDS